MSSFLLFSSTETRPRGERFGHLIIQSAFLMIHRLLFLQGIWFKVILPGSIGIAIKNRNMEYIDIFVKNGRNYDKDVEYKNTLLKIKMNRMLGELHPRLRGDSFPTPEPGQDNACVGKHESALHRVLLIFKDNPPEQVDLIF